MSRLIVLIAEQECEVKSMTRQEAKELIIKLSMMCDYTDTYGDAIDTEPYDKAVDMAIRSLETDTVEVVRGKWIKHIDNQYPQESTEECSVCHHHQFLSVMLDNNYCPNCGARMEDKK